MARRAPRTDRHLLWWHQRLWWRKFTSVRRTQRRQIAARPTSKDGCHSDSPSAQRRLADEQQHGNSPPDQCKPVRAAVQELSEVKRQLFASPPQKPAPPPPILKQGAARTASSCTPNAACIEAGHLDELNALHIPVLDVRLLNAVINSRMAALKRAHSLRTLRLLTTYTKRLAAYNPDKWRSISERYQARLSVLTARDAG